MLIIILPKHSVSEVIGCLKGKSSLIIFDKYANLKYKHGTTHFGAADTYQRFQFQNYVIFTISCGVC